MPRRWRGLLTLQHEHRQHHADDAGQKREDDPKGPQVNPTPDSTVPARAAWPAAQARPDPPAVLPLVPRHALH
jgi:hypothetical protein